jgi:sugar phosphate isomerase/epimerase
MQRRKFIQIASQAAAFAPQLRRANTFNLGAISDSFSENFEDALKIMSSYGLDWVEIRNVYGVYNTEAGPAHIQRIKELLTGYRFRVSVIDSALYKCTLPGTQPVRGQRSVHSYQEQSELLKRACDRAHAFGADKVRGFTFWRVAEPANIEERISEELVKAARVAKREGVRLVIENEETCNAATGRELARVLTMAPEPNLGANWDVGNGYWQGEASYPDGYNALDKSRIWHMHLKGVICAVKATKCAETLAGAGENDLRAQFVRLIRDGYQETMSLECEFQRPGISHLETSKRSLEGLLKIRDAALYGW